MKNCLRKKLEGNGNVLYSVIKDDQNNTGRYRRILLIRKHLTKNKQTCYSSDLCVEFAFSIGNNELTREVYDEQLEQIKPFNYGTFHDADLAMKKAHEFALQFYEDFYKSNGLSLEDRTGIK